MHPRTKYPNQIVPEDLWPTVEEAVGSQTLRLLKNWNCQACDGEEFLGRKVKGIFFIIRKLAEKVQNLETQRASQPTPQRIPQLAPQPTLQPTPQLAPQPTLQLTPQPTPQPTLQRIGRERLGVVQCYRCFGFGHIASHCSKQQVCGFCSLDGHTSSFCPGREAKRPPNCINCNGCHQAWAVKCTSRPQEQQQQQQQQQQRSQPSLRPWPRPQPQPSRTYAQVAKHMQPTGTKSNTTPSLQQDLQPLLQLFIQLLQQVKPL